LTEHGISFIDPDLPIAYPAKLLMRKKREVYQKLMVLMMFKDRVEFNWEGVQ